MSFLMMGTKNLPQKKQEDDLDVYMAMPQADMDTNPLQWWKEKSKTVLPKLAQLVKTVLCVPATSTPSERVFSTMGVIITKLRNRLSASTAEAILFLKKNDFSSFKPKVDDDTDDI